MQPLDRPLHQRREILAAAGQRHGFDEEADGIRSHHAIDQRAGIVFRRQLFARLLLGRARHIKHVAACRFDEQRLLGVKIIGDLARKGVGCRSNIGNRNGRQPLLLEQAACRIQQTRAHLPARGAGRQMRSRLLDTASRLFKEQGLAAVSIADIAAAANAFPSQITYYFHTKEALFVEAACRDVLYVARAAEQHAGKQLSPEDYTRALVDSVMGSDAVGFFVEAMTLTRRRQDLAPLVERTVERLHSEGLRAYAAEMAARGWRSRLDPDTSARRFWAIAIGVCLLYT